MARVFKSYDQEDPVKNYCLANSSPQHPVQLKLIEETMKHSRYKMLGAPEVINMNALLIKSLGGKKVIDVGVFTGASSLGAALALPEDGVVVACDVSEEFTAIGRPFWREAGVEHKIKLTIAPAADTLAKLVAAGEENTFDFAFIDADKPGYDTYFELCLKLMRKGGIIAFDNTLQGGKVVSEDTPDDNWREGVLAIRRLNEKLGRDSRVTTVMMNIGDGYTLATKL